VVTIWQTYSGNTQTASPIAGPSTGGVSAPGGWHPTVLYLIVLLAAEIFLVGLLSRTVLR
jgi:hypothetical protein